MIFRMFNLKINASDRAEFLKVGRHNLTTSIKTEPDTLTMYATHADSAGTDNYIFEVYQDENAYDIHSHSPQFKNFAEMAKKVVKEKTIVQLTPELLVEQINGFTIMDSQAIVQLNQVNLTKNQLASLLPQLRQAVKNDPQFYACLVGSDVDNPEKITILTTYQNQAAAEHHHSLFSGTLLFLHPDTIVSHGGLDYKNHRSH